MINAKISKIFYLIAEYYSMDEVAFKPQAYERAARLIESMEEDLAEVYKKGGLKALTALPGIGQGLAEKIEEYAETGKIKEYEDLKKKCPVDLENLTKIEGLGPKTIKTLWEKLGVKTVGDLERAAAAGKIKDLPRFGEKIQKNILRGIAFSKGDRGRFLLGYVLPLARKIEKSLKSLDFVEEAVAAGSVRRMKETVGDLDFLVVSPAPDKVAQYFCNMPEVEKILAQGEAKISVRLDLGLDADVRIVPKESFGAALQYFTGNVDHNVVLRKLAQDKSMKLNEYGIFALSGKKITNSKIQIINKSQIQNNKLQKEKFIAGKTEEEIYQTLGLEWMPPELRENTGEIQAAQEEKLPNLVVLKDIKGDLQMHSEWSDGADSIKELAGYAKNLGYEYIAVTDHTGELRVAGGMDEPTILRYFAEIEKIGRAQTGLKILKGLEVNIRKDGTLDIADEILAKADIVLASVHSNFKMPREEMTQRLCRAMSNPHVDIIAHPTGRVIQRREGYQVDFEKILACAKRTGTVLEINSYPDRLDLNDVRIKKAVEAGVKLSLGTDSHSKNQLNFMELGVAQARRGWATVADIINTYSFDKLIKFLKEHKT